MASQAENSLIVINSCAQREHTSNRDCTVTDSTVSFQREKVGIWTFSSYAPLLIKHCDFTVHVYSVSHFVHSHVGIEMQVLELNLFE